MEEYPEIEFMVHIHDTRNMGMVNTLAAIECGINTVQATAGGLGGCPFAPGASGNTASEDLIYMLNKMGYDTGVDFDKLLEAARFIHEHVDGNYSGHHLNIKKT
jgi:hydroxymethylglutaryl-CoA lyase